MVQVNIDRYAALQEVAAVAVELVLPVGPNFHDRVRGLPAWIREVATHAICHGAMAALEAAHLHIEPDVDLRMVEPGFPTRAEMPEDVDIKQLIADFGAAANAVTVVVSVEQVIKDAPSQG